MAIELATAIVRIRANTTGLKGQVGNVKKFLQAELGKIRVGVVVVPKLDPKALATIKSALSRVGLVQSGKGQAGGGRAGQGAGGVNMSRDASIMSGASRVATGKKAFGGQLGGFAKGSFQIATGILGAQAALGTLAIPVKAIQSAAEFESAMIRVRSVTGATTLQFSKLEKTALKLGEKTVFTAQEAANAMVILGQKGLSAIETINATPIILDFAAAGRVSPEQAATTLVNIMNAMQLSTDQLRETSNVLTRMALKTSADVQSIGEAFKFVGPLADLAGISINEVTAALSLLSDVGLGGSIGGTGFKRIIAGLLEPATIQKLEGLLGTSLTSLREVKTTGRIDLVKIIEEINTAFGEAALGTEKATLAMRVFLQRAGPQFAALLQQGSDALRERIQVTKDLGITTKGVAEDEMNSLIGAWKRLGAVINTTFIESVNPAKASITGMLDGLAKMISSVRDLSSNVYTFSFSLAAVAIALKASAFAANFAMTRYVAMSNAVKKAVLLNQSLIVSSKLLKIALIGVVAVLALVAIEISGIAREVERLNRGIEKGLGKEEKKARRIAEGRTDTLDDIGEMTPEKAAIRTKIEIRNTERNSKALEKVISLKEKEVEIQEKLVIAFGGSVAQAKLRVLETELAVFEERRDANREFLKDLERINKTKSRQTLEADLEAARQLLEQEKLDEELAKLKNAQTEPEKFRSQFLGIEEFGKQIQLSVLNDQKDRTQKQIVANGTKANTLLASIDRKVGDPDGRFA